MKFLSILSLLALFSGSAYAADAPNNEYGFYFKPYVGADYEYTGVSYGNVAGTGVSYGDIFPSSFNGGDIHIGARLHKYFGIESSYFDTASSNKSGVLGTSASSSARFNGWSIDAMGYIPIAQKFELIGTAGYARIDTKGSISISGTTFSDSGWSNAGRVGGGAQYWITDNFNIRGLVRYENINRTGIDNAVLADIGINWQF